MNMILLRQMRLLSVIIGLASGILVFIPILNILVFLTMMLATSVVILIYMKKRNLIGLLTSQQAALYGAFMGFVTYIGFSITMIPLALLLSWINSVTIKKAFWFSFVATFFPLSIGNIFVMLVFAGFLAIMGAMFNAFSAMIIAYIMQQIEEGSVEKDEFKIDIK